MQTGVQRGVFLLQYCVSRAELFLQWFRLWQKPHIHFIFGDKPLYWFVCSPLTFEVVGTNPRPDFKWQTWYLLAVVDARRIAMNNIHQLLCSAFLHPLKVSFWYDIDKVLKITLNPKSVLVSKPQNNNENVNVKSIDPNFFLILINFTKKNCSVIYSLI